MKPLESAVESTDLSKYGNRADDFNAGGTSAKIEKGKKYFIGRMMDIPSKQAKAGVYPAFEVFALKGNGQQGDFLGYISATRVQGQTFVEIATSRAGKLYAKMLVNNRFGAPEGTTYGLASLKAVLSNQKISCTDVKTEPQPKFGADLSLRNVEMDNVDVYLLSL